MSTTTISGSGIRNNRGVILGGGNISGSAFSTLSITSNSTDAVNRFTQIYPSFKTGIESILKGDAVSITAISQSGSTGYVNIQKSSHGLSVGDLIVVYGADVDDYNTVHRVTVVTNSSNVQTDVFYTSAISSVHGSYKPFSGRFGKMTAGKYVGMVMCDEVAGNSSSILRITASDYHRVPFNPARGSHRYNITGWSYTTGAATKGASSGDQVLYHNIASNNDTLAYEPFPSMAVPGEFVYSAGQLNIPVQADYSVKNG